MSYPWARSRILPRRKKLERNKLIPCWLYRMAMHTLRSVQVKKMQLGKANSLWMLSTCFFMTPLSLSYALHPCQHRDRGLADWGREKTHYWSLPALWRQRQRNARPWRAGMQNFQPSSCTNISATERRVLGYFEVADNFSSLNPHNCYPMLAAVRWIRAGFWWWQLWENLCWGQFFHLYPVSSTAHAEPALNMPEWKIKAFQHFIEFFASRGSNYMENQWIFNAVVWDSVVTEWSPFLYIQL